jgi:hypothetical protein
MTVGLKRVNTPYSAQREAITNTATRAHIEVYVPYSNHLTVITWRWIAASATTVRPLARSGSRSTHGIPLILFTICDFWSFGDKSANQYRDPRPRTCLTPLN